MKYGYCRVSTEEQNLDLQIDALEKEGCDKIFQEKKSGATLERSQFNKLMETLKEGDTLVVWHIDRLGRNLVDLVNIMNTLKEAQIEFKSLSNNLDTLTDEGDFVYKMSAVFAEYEKNKGRRRTLKGLAAARSRGRIGGRPKGLSQDAKNKAIAAEALYREGTLSVRKIAEHLNISTSTLYEYLKHRGVVLFT